MYIHYFQVLRLCTCICCWFCYYFIFIFILEPQVRRSRFFAMRLLIAYFKFWDGMKNFISNMWQVVFTKICVHGRVIYSYVYGFFYGLCQIVPLLADDFEAVHCWYMASDTLLFKYGWRCFQMIFVSFFNGPV